jgi:hypothetical protein
MEPMQIEIQSLIVDDRFVEVRARAFAEEANIRLKVRFRHPQSATIQELQELARHEVLRYLDPA